MRPFSDAVPAFLSLLSACEALASSGPTTLDQLLHLFYPDKAAPSYVQIKSPAIFAVAGNDSAALKLSSLDVNPYPLSDGHNEFRLAHSLASDLPEASVLHLKAYYGDEELYEGDIELCEYLVFAKLHCPINAYGFQYLQKLLQIPDTAHSGTYSFLATARTPGGALILQLIGAVEINIAPLHDEL